MNCPQWLFELQKRNHTHFLMYSTGVPATAGARHRYEKNSPSIAGWYVVIAAVVEKAEAHNPLSCGPTARAISFRQQGVGVGPGGGGTGARTPEGK